MTTASAIDTDARAGAVARCIRILLEAAQRRRQRQAEQEHDEPEEETR